jgi:hypothetical protein
MSVRTCMFVRCRRDLAEREHHSLQMNRLQLQSRYLVFRFARFFPRPPCISHCCALPLLVVPIPVSTTAWLILEPYGCRITSWQRSFSLSERVQSRRRDANLPSKHPFLYAINSYPLLLDLTILPPLQHQCLLLCEILRTALSPGSHMIEPESVQQLDE